MFYHVSDIKGRRMVERPEIERGRPGSKKRELSYTPSFERVDS